MAVSPRRRGAEDPQIQDYTPCHRSRSKRKSSATPSRSRKRSTEEAAPKPLAPAAGDAANVIRMHEKLERPEMLIGSTYKVKTPVSDHAMYVTINDIVLNEGTEYEQRRPFEIFINSKNLDHYQWIVALTRIISAVFRKGGDVTFLVDELKAVFDPRGGYWQPGGKFMPSIIAELGHIVEKHLQSIGLLKTHGPRQASARAHRAKSARNTKSSNASRNAFTENDGQQSGRRAALRQVQRSRRDHDGWLHDLPVVRRFEVRVGRSD